MNELNDLTLSLIPSKKCNIRCSYCYFCKTPSLAESTENIKKALLNGEYLKNIEKTLTRYGYTFLSIKKVDLWGGETTFNLDSSKEFFKDLVVNKGKNIEVIGFSSNGTVNADAICELAKYLDNEIDRNLAIAMQISCDGPDYILKQSRGIEFKQIDSNVQKIIDFFNHTKFNNIRFELHFKATFTLDMLRQIYASKESCIKYWAWWNTMMTDYKNQVINGQFTFNNLIPLPAVGIVRPVDYTQQDGIDYAEIMKKNDLYDICNEVNKVNHRRKGKPGYCDPDLYENPYTSLCKDALLDDIQDPIDTSCNQCNTDLIIDERGNLYPCTSAMLMYENKGMEELSNIDKFEALIQKDVVEKTFAINPGSETDEKWKNWLYDVRSSIFNNYSVDWNDYELYAKPTTNFLFVSAASYTILDYLSKAGLVSDSYKYDEEKKLKHARAVCGHCRCVYNNLTTTGSAYVCNLGEYKLLCNGAYDYTEQYYRNRKLIDKRRDNFNDRPPKFNQIQK